MLPYVDSDGVEEQCELPDDQAMASVSNDSAQRSDEVTEKQRSPQSTEQSVSDRSLNMGLLLGLVIAIFAVAASVWVYHYGA